MGCDDFQMAIERELHGALPETERAPLRDHLSSCEACRAYQAAARGTEGAMAENASEALREVDWSRVERGIRQGMLASVRAVVMAVLFGTLMFAVIWFASAPAFRADRMLRVGAALAVTLALVALTMGYAAWRMARLERGAEMLEAWRRGIRVRVRALRVMPWVNGLIAALCLWRAVEAARAQGQPETVHRPLVYAVLGTVLLAAALYARLVKLPRARRELEELERDGKA
jgi:hypothetical protein